MKTDMQTPMSSFSLGRGDAPEFESKSVGRDPEDLTSRIDGIMPRLLPLRGSGDEGDVVTLDANLVPQWEPGAASLPDGINESDILVWDDTLKEWVVFDDVIDLIRLWNQSTSQWTNIEVPADVGMVLQTLGANPVLKFDYMKWR